MQKDSIQKCINKYIYIYIYIKYILKKKKKFIIFSKLALNLTTNPLYPPTVSSRHSSLGSSAGSCLGGRLDWLVQRVKVLFLKKFVTKIEIN